jgi:acetyl esterase/lipase
VYAERDGYRPLELDVHRAAVDEIGPADGERGDGRHRGERNPLVVYVHGGGWRTSHRSRAPRETRGWDPGFFELLTGSGFVVAAIEYRFSAEALFPAQLDDTVDALHWLRANADDLGIDPDRVYLWGCSGGGALVALAALVEQAPPVAGVVCVYAITDLLSHDPDRTDSFEALLVGGPIRERQELARRASAVTYAHAGAPPFLIQHGDRDTWVPVEQSVRLAGALRDAGARNVELEIVPGADHFFEGADDIEAIYSRALAFLLSLDTVTSDQRRVQDR